MKYPITLMSLVVLLNAPVLAIDVNFSKAYILTPLPTEVSDVPPSPTLQIGCVETIETHEDGVIIFKWVLSLDFDPSNATFHLREAQSQNNSEHLPVRHFDVGCLRGTTWRGEYKTANNLYTTELRFQSVQNGFIGGEITHTTKDNPEPSSFLKAKVAGDITTQYLIDEKGEGDLIWVNVNEYLDKVVELNQANEGKEGDDITPIPPILETRQLIRLKRTRRIGDSKHANSQWGSNNEYRLTLEYDKLTGSVGTPPERYSMSDALTGVGNIELTISEPIGIPPSALE